MTTIREWTHQYLLERGITRIFGNPGSNELSFLTGLPDGLEYILGLHEGVAVGMADGYAQASGEPAFVNLHTHSGTGNAMGALTNAHYSRTPLIVTAGQQVRETTGYEPLLTNEHAELLPQPLTMWSKEPLSAADVPRALSQAFWQATRCTPGPVYVSIPWDDWDAEVGENADFLPPRQVTIGDRLSAEQVSGIARRLDAVERVGLVVGQAVDAARCQEDVIALAERLDADVWLAPWPSRLGFRTGHPNFHGFLLSSIVGVADALEPYDLVLVVGAAVFRYHEYDPGRFLKPGTALIQITDDPAEAARAPFGESYVAGLGPTCRALAEALSARDHPARPDVSPPASAPEPSGGRFEPARVFQVLREELPPNTAYVDESTATTEDFFEQMRLDEPASYFRAAAAGLGFGMPAALGVKLACPERTVVAVIGDGSANYGITALWSAARYRIAVPFVIMRNDTYGILRDFTEELGIDDAPGLELPAIDFVAIARGYGVDGVAVTSEDELRAALRHAAASDEPYLIEVPTACPAS